jgi:hypothetical protein
VREALRIVHCTDCAPETSCYHCLRDYSNQIYHKELRRGEVARFLETLLRDLTPSIGAVAGVGNVVVANLPLWLMRQLEQSRVQLMLVAHTLTLEQPTGATRNWLDMLYDLVQRKLDVFLYLHMLPGHDPDGLSIAEHLRVLMSRGLRLWHTKHVPQWIATIDPAQPDSQRAIGLNSQVDFCLNADSGQGGLITTIHADGVEVAHQQIMAMDARLIQAHELQAPPHTRVLNIQANQLSSEKALFQDVFQTPVRRMTVNDPYLWDTERIINRLGAYIALAANGGKLEQVEVMTKRAGNSGVRGSEMEQSRTFGELMKWYKGIITFNYKQVHHDRFILLERTDGTKARILIGQGLDFIQPNGRTKPTYVVIEDPV